MQKLNEKRFNGFDPEDSQTGFVAATGFLIALVSAGVLLVGITAVEATKGFINWLM